MIERIRQIKIESAWLLTEVIGADFEIERTVVWLQASLDDLSAINDPSDAQIEEVFLALAGLQSNLLSALGRVPKQYQPLIKNLTDRIEIFCFTIVCDVSTNKTYEDTGSTINSTTGAARGNAGSIGRPNRDNSVTP